MEAPAGPHYRVAPSGGDFLGRAAVFSAILAFVPIAARAQSAGAAGELYSFGANARGLAMGSAQTAAVSDVTALYYNPAGLGLLPGREITLMRAKLFEGATYDYLGYAQNKKKRAGGWGVELVRLGAAGDDGRDESNNKTGGFGYAETALGVGHGWRGVFHPSMSIGVKGKLLRRSLGPSSDQTLGLDFGAQFGPIVNEKLTLGLVILNAVALAQGDTDDRLKPQIRAGAAFRVVGPMSVAADLSQTGELRVGTEYAFGMTSVRVGMADKSLSFGGGLQFRRKYFFDMALTNHASLGMSQRFSIGYKFGGALPRAGSEKSPKMEAYAGEYLKNAVAELQKRNYLRASKDVDTAIGIDPKIGKGEWMAKAERLRRLVKEIALAEHPEDQEALSVESQAALIGAQCVDAYLLGEEDRAMLLAHAALGSANRSPAFRRLLDGVAKLTGREKSSEDILGPERLSALKMKQAVEAVYARRFDVGARLLREALWLDPRNAMAWTRLGSAYFAMGDKVRAKLAWQKAIELNPADESLRNFMKQQGFE